MNTSALGGGILFAAIALLWIAVLAPSLARGRQFRAAEQNAARLQRTLRILAETAAIPEEHYVEATAREALAQEKKLKAVRRHFEQARKQELQHERARLRAAEMRNQKELAKQQALLRGERLRSKKFQPVRLSAAMVTLLGIMTVFVGLIGAAFSWLSWFVPLAGVGAIFAGFSTLVLLAPGARKKAMAEVKPVHVFLPEFYEQEASKEDVVSDSHKKHFEAQAKAAADLERSRVLAEVRAQARARAAIKQNITGSMFLTSGGAGASGVGGAGGAGGVGGAGGAGGASASTSTRSRSGTSMPNSSKNETRIDNQAERNSSAPQSLSERLKNMGVVGDTQTVDVDDLLKRRRNAS